MSRIGKAPIAIPAGVDVNTQSGVVTVKGPGGQMSLDLVSGIELKQEDGQIMVDAGEDSKLQAMAGKQVTVIGSV